MASVFISYSHADREFVVRLVADLERAGVSVWLDVRELRVGDSVLRSIRVGIDRADYLIAVLSSQSVASEWVQREIDVAANIEVESGKKKILPAVLGPVDLPAMLKGKLYADFSREYETGLRAIKEALRLAEDQDFVMVSVLVKDWIVEDVVKNLKSRGFDQQTLLPPMPVRLEIAGGYLSFIRGDHGGKAGRFSAFQPPPSLKRYRNTPVLKRDRTLVFFSEVEDWRAVLHIAGPSQDVGESARGLLEERVLTDGARRDLEDALKWWDEPRFNAQARVVTLGNQRKS